MDFFPSMHSVSAVKTVHFSEQHVKTLISVVSLESHASALKLNSHMFIMKANPHVCSDRQRMAESDTMLMMWKTINKCGATAPALTL